MVYLAADNSLARFALADLDEMKAGMAKVNSSGVHLLVYVDTGSSPRLVELENRNGTVVETTIKTYEDNRNSVGLAETAEVLNDAFSNDAYKAESYGLIYWSHGDGWIPNPLPATRWVGQDTGNGTHYMNIEDLVSILSGAPHLDFLLFDACFMQSIEVAYALRPFTDYCIGSPTEIPGPGADYEALVPALFADGDIALNIAEAYYTPYADIYDDGDNISNDNWTGGVSVGVLKTSELDALASVTRQVLQASAYPDDLRSEVFDYDQRSRSSSSRVGYYDMQAMMRLLTDDAGFEEWKQAYDAAVVYWKTTPLNYSAYVGMFSMEGAAGVSHYIPNPNKPSATSAYRSTSWYTDAGLSQLGW